MDYAPAVIIINVNITTLVNSSNFNATNLKISEKFDHPFSHLFIFGDMFPESHGFDAVPIAISLY